MATSTLLPALDQLQSLLAHKGVDVDPDIDQMQQFNLNPANFHLASGGIMGYLMGLDRKALTSKLNRLAATLSLHSTLSLVQLCQKVVQHVPADGLRYIMEFVSYDETPMLCNVRDPQPQQLLQSLQGTLQGPEEDTLLEMQNVLGRGRTDAVIAKLLQTRSCYGLIFDVLPQVPLILIGECPQLTTIYGSCEC